MVRVVRGRTFSATKGGHTLIENDNRQFSGVFSGPWGPRAKQFIHDLGKRIADVTNDKRATLFLKQRISLDIQRGNAASVLGTLPSTEALDEVYYLLSNRKPKQ